MVSEPAPNDRFDLVLVAVRAEQLPGVLQMVTGMTDDSDMLFYGNIDHRATRLEDALPGRAFFGFPAAGGSRDDSTIKYVLIRQQKTMLGELDGSVTARVKRPKRLLTSAGFPTQATADIGGWLLGHAAFVVPVAFALYRIGVDPIKLSADQAKMRLIIPSTRETFTALRASKRGAVPGNLRVLYRMPAFLVVAYRRRVFRGPTGEMWFAAHSRAAPEEMHALVRHRKGGATGQRVPDTQPATVDDRLPLSPTRLLRPRPAETTCGPPRRYRKTPAQRLRNGCSLLVLMMRGPART